MPVAVRPYSIPNILRARGVATAGRMFGVFGMFEAAVLLTLGAASLGAQRATQTVSFRVEPINQLSVQGSPVLEITTAIAGRAPTSVSAPGGSWNVTTNQSDAKISASVDSPLPPGVTLSVELTPPPGAQSAGFTALTATPVDVVSNLSRVAARGLALTYRLDALPMSGVVVAGSRTVTFTITGGM